MLTSTAHGNWFVEGLEGVPKVATWRVSILVNSSLLTPDVENVVRTWTLPPLSKFPKDCPHWASSQSAGNRTAFAPKLSSELLTVLSITSATMAAEIKSKLSALESAISSGTNLSSSASVLTELKVRFISNLAVAAEAEFLRWLFDFQSTWLTVDTFSCLNNRLL